MSENWRSKLGNGAFTILGLQATTKALTVAEWYLVFNRCVEVLHTKKLLCAKKRALLGIEAGSRNLAHFHSTGAWVPTIFAVQTLFAKLLEAS